MVEYNKDSIFTKFMEIYPKMNTKNSALLVIDIVNFCAHQKCERPEWNIHFSKIRKMVPRLEAFIEKFRTIVKAPIIFCNLVPWQKEFLPDNLKELYTDPNACYYKKDNSGFPEKFYQLKPHEGDIVITKNNYDAFTSKTLEKFLKDKKIRYLVVTGVFGDGCVMATICGGFSQGYNFVILKDLIETMDHQTRQDLQRLLKDFTWPVMYGKTMDSEDFLKSWEKEWLK